jgi:uncharacterized protein (UPF0333 family)
MIFSKRGQTATEYMIILAVVIIIALIVVGVMGGIPGIGGSTRSRSAEAYWQTADIAIVSAAMTATVGNEHTVKLRNNLKSTITVTNVTLSTSGSGDVQEFDDTSTVLTPGQSASFSNITAFGICSNSGDSYTSNVAITYTDSETGATYVFTGDGNKFEGTCAN